MAAPTATLEIRGRLQDETSFRDDMEGQGAKLMMIDGAGTRTVWSTNYNTADLCDAIRRTARGWRFIGEHVVVDLRAQS